MKYPEILRTFARKIAWGRYVDIPDRTLGINGAERMESLPSPNYDIFYQGKPRLVSKDILYDSYTGIPGYGKVIPDEEMLRTGGYEFGPGIRGV